jgi:hypothetical protein
MAESAQSSTVSATPIAPAPAVPTGLIATPGNTSVALAWNASSNATGYSVYYGINPSSLSKVTVSPGSTYNTQLPSFTVTGLTNGTLYYFAVTAIN